LRGLAKRFHHRDHEEHGETALKISVDSVCSVVRGFLSPFFKTLSHLLVVFGEGRVGQI
jgi:hypothetical protein